MEIKDNVFVITGGARGLGLATALRLAQKGANLALVDLDSDALSDAAGVVRESGAGQVETYAANVAAEDDVVSLFERIVADIGVPDGLVNNAGITRDALLLKFRDGELVSKMSLEQWQAVIDVNLTGVFLCGREAAVKMIEAGKPGCIVNIASISKAGNIGQSNYSAAKAGVEALAVTWAKELARYGIRATSVAPGFIGTDMVEAMKPEAREKLVSMIPAGRVGDPDEIARTIEFIFENDYLNGRSIDVDGGLRL